jgi:Domain of unknown function (DUF4413)
LAIACVLDTRCKFAVVEYYIEKMYADDECSRFIANLKSCMNELFKEYSEAHSMLVQNQASNSTQQPLRYCSEHEFKLYRDYKLLPCRVIIVAWSLVALWLFRSKAMIFNDEIGIYCILWLRLVFIAEK